MHVLGKMDLWSFDRENTKMQSRKVSDKFCALAVKLSHILGNFKEHETEL
jgi:hypothetical protein